MFTGRTATGANARTAAVAAVDADESDRDEEDTAAVPARRPSFSDYGSEETNAAPARRPSFSDYGSEGDDSVITVEHSRPYKKPKVNHESDISGYLKTLSETIAGRPPRQRMQPEPAVPALTPAALAGNLLTDMHSEAMNLSLTDIIRLKIFFVGNSAHSEMFLLMPPMERECYITYQLSQL